MDSKTLLIVTISGLAILATTVMLVIPSSKL